MKLVTRSFRPLWLTSVMGNLRHQKCPQHYLKCYKAEVILATTTLHLQDLEHL